MRPPHIPPDHPPRPKSDQEYLKERIIRALESALLEVRSNRKLLPTPEMFSWTMDGADVVRIKVDLHFGDKP